MHQDVLSGLTGKVLRVLVLYVWCQWDASGRKDVHQDPKERRELAQCVSESVVQSQGLRKQI